MSDARKGLTSSVAQYYCMLGTEEFKKTTMKEMQDIFHRRTTFPGLTEEDIQQVWEVYVVMASQLGMGWVVTNKKLPKDANGEPRLLAEWDDSLITYNYKLVNGILKLIKGRGKGIDAMLESFQKVEKNYQRLTGKKLYVCVRSEYQRDNLKEIHVDVHAMMKGKIQTKDAVKCYEDAVFYELSEAIAVSMKERKKIKSQYYKKLIRIDEYNNYTEFYAWYVRGLELYTDLALGHDWGSTFTYTTRSYTGVY